MENNAKTVAWSENVIIADGDYIDHVAFNLIVNFERMIGRRIPKADVAKWLDCVALDGGVRAGEEQTQVVFVHDKRQIKLENFAPSLYEEELNGKAFKDNLGEFLISSYPVEEVVSKEDFISDILTTVCSQKEVKRIMLIPDVEKENVYARIRSTLQYVDDDKRITLFSMQPMPGGNFRQEILGYSLMSALGIKAEEIKAE